MGEEDHHVLGLDTLTFHGYPWNLKTDCSSAPGPGFGRPYLFLGYPW